MKPTIGFIGLGLMGQAFTQRLCSLDYTVVGYDLVAEKLAAAAEHGVVPAATPADLTARAGADVRYGLSHSTSIDAKD